MAYIDTVKMPYDLAVASGGDTFRINTEDIRLDTRTTKGKLMFKADISTFLSNRNSKNVGEKFLAIVQT